MRCKKLHLNRSKKNPLASYGRTTALQEKHFVGVFRFCMCGMFPVSELDPLDPWKKYGPPPEPRLTFIISEGHMSSPPLQVSWAAHFIS